MPLNFGGQKRSGAFDTVWPSARLTHRPQSMCGFLHRSCGVRGWAPARRLWGWRGALGSTCVFAAGCVSVFRVSVSMLFRKSFKPGRGPHQRHSGSGPRRRCQRRTQPSSITRKSRNMKKLTASEGLPRRSPTPVLTGPCAAQLRRSEEIRCIRHGMAVSGNGSRCEQRG